VGHIFFFQEMLKDKTSLYGGLEIPTLGSLGIKLVMDGNFYCEILEGRI